MVPPFAQGLGQRTSQRSVHHQQFCLRSDRREHTTQLVSTALRRFDER